MSSVERGWWRAWRFQNGRWRAVVATFWMMWRCHHWPFFIAKGYDMDCPHKEGAE